MPTNQTQLISSKSKLDVSPEALILIESVIENMGKRVKICKINRDRHLLLHGKDYTIIHDEDFGENE